jgi:ribosomal protein S18 acetylase RimI-like enzyme
VTASRHRDRTRRNDRRAAARRRNTRRPQDWRVVRVTRGSAQTVVRAAGLFDEAPDAVATRAYLADRRNVLLVAYSGADPVGFLRGTALGQLHNRRPQMFLYEIGVLAKFRRRGVGRALIARLLTYCRARDFEEVFVLTSPSNTAAVGLYRATGAINETSADRMFVYRLSGSGRSPAGRGDRSGPGSRRRIANEPGSFPRTRGRGGRRSRAGRLPG